MKRTIAVVDGISVGHAHDERGCTGCTVVLAPAGGASGASVTRGYAASTRQTGIADPLHIAHRVDAVLLAGGSAFGLDAAAGVMEILAAEGRGFASGHGIVPSVPTAILFDLGLGEGDARPTPEMAREATLAAMAGASPAAGSVGAGAGATIGKIRGVPCATKGGVGTAGVRTRDGLEVGALAAVNAFGDVVDPEARTIVAGARRSPRSLKLLDTSKEILAGRMRTSFGPTNTTLVVVATNARLEEPWLRRVAAWAGDGIADAVRPAFTVVDGDTVVALATGAIDAEPHRVGLLARRCVRDAILGAARLATPLGGLPTASQLSPRPS